MPNIDMHAQLTSWVAQELEASASTDVIRYMVVAESRGFDEGDQHYSYLALLVYLEWGGKRSFSNIAVPDESHVRYSVRHGLEDLGILKAGVVLNAGIAMTEQIRRQAQAVFSSGKGTRNDTLYSSAFTLAKAGADKTQAMAALIDAAVNRSMSDEEARRTFLEAWAAAGS